MKKKSKEKFFSKCAKCGQLCCRYITIKVPAPRTIRECDGLLWQVYHKNIIVFKDSTGWHLLVFSPCDHLKKNGKCAIYEARPITCREHSGDECEFDEAILEASEYYFDSHEKFAEFCRKKFKTWDRRF